MVTETPKHASFWTHILYSIALWAAISVANLHFQVLLLQTKRWLKFITGLDVLTKVEAIYTTEVIFHACLHKASFKKNSCRHRYNTRQAKDFNLQLITEPFLLKKTSLKDCQSVKVNVFVTVTLLLKGRFAEVTAFNLTIVRTQ